MDECGLGMKEFHEFLCVMRFASSRGILKEGHFMAPSSCSGDVFDQREKPLPYLGTNEPFSDLVGREQAKRQEGLQSVADTWLQSSVSPVRKLESRNRTSEGGLQPHSFISLLNGESNLYL